jgi:hypothetical protein
VSVSSRGICSWYDPTDQAKSVISEKYANCRMFLLGVGRRNAQLFKTNLKPRVNYDIEICDFHDHVDEEERKACKEKAK